MSNRSVSMEHEQHNSNVGGERATKTFQTKFANMQTTLKHIPDIIAGSVTPIIFEFLSTFPNKVAQKIFEQYPDSPEHETDELIQQTIYESLKSWYHNNDFYVRRTAEVESRFPDLMTYWEDYTKEFFYIIPRVRNYDNSVIEQCEFELTRPSMLMFIKNVYQMVIKSLVRDLELFELDDDLDRLITSKVKIVIKKLISMDKLMEVHRKMEECHQEWLLNRRNTAIAQHTSSKNDQPQSRKTNKRRPRKRRHEINDADVGEEDGNTEVNPNSDNEMEAPLSKRDVPMDVVLYTMAEMEKQKELQSEASKKSQDNEHQQPRKLGHKTVSVRGDFPSKDNPPKDITTNGSTEVQGTDEESDNELHLIQESHESDHKDDEEWSDDF